MLLPNIVNISSNFGCCLNTNNYKYRGLDVAMLILTVNTTDVQRHKSDEFANLKHSLLKKKTFKGSK